MSGDHSIPVSNTTKTYTRSAARDYDRHLNTLPTTFTYVWVNVNNHNVKTYFTR